jgi:class 3 adenylate cyclase/tetratricopeptide (TPR) repeat protein
VSFLETVERARHFLERHRRVSLRALRREFGLDAETLAELSDELVQVQRVAVAEDEVLVWRGGESSASAASPPASPSAGRDPRVYTPKHLAEKILTSRSALEGERKQVTVLFADVRGSMDLAGLLDPEAWHGILDRFFTILNDGVHRFEGTVNQYTGDGIMALFGAPIAHEDHAQRACYAALHLQRELRRYADEMRLEHGLNFSVRMGLNSGEVVVGKIGDDLRMDYTAQGHTVGLAARMEQIAEAGKVLLTGHTANLVTGYFALRDLGETRIKGVSEPLHVFELEGVGRMRTRLEVSHARGFTKFVGRSNEMAALEAALERATSGNAQVVGVVAEAGTGKSRLCYEFAERCRGRGIPVYEAHGVAYGKTIPLLPVIEFFRGYFGITEQDTPRAARDKIAGRMVLLDEKLAEGLPVMFDLLGLTDPERPSSPLGPEELQRRFFDVTRRLGRARSDREPAVLLFEDLHWFDRASEKFVYHTVDVVAPGNRTLVLLNFRPEYHATWMQKSYYQQLALAPLSAGAIDALLHDLVGAGASVKALPRLIRERTGGNPFFIEEVVQALVEDGSLVGGRGAYRLVKPMEKVALPATVQALLGARIDRLESREKHLLQTAAVIGREFAEPVLKRVAELAEAELAESLGKLNAAEFIYEKALYPEPEYVFKHALTQEVAYHSVLGERRKVLHERVAQAIEVLFADSLEGHYGELAHHYALSDNRAKAVEYLHLAGEQAAERGANAEAVSNLTAALELLPTLPETAERDRKELGLQTMLAGVLVATKGWAALERERALERARDLGQRLGESLELGPVLTSLCQVYLQQGRLSAAGELAERTLRLAEDLEDPEFLAAAHYNVGEACLWTGELVRAHAHCERTIALCDPKEHRSVAWIGVDPWMLSTCALSLCEQFIGRPDQALRRILAAVGRLREDPSRLADLAVAQLIAALVHQLRREQHAARDLAEANLTLCSEQGFGEWLAWSRWIRGAALGELGQEEEGIREIVQGIEEYRSNGSTICLSWALGLLASVHGRIGQIDEAFGRLTEAFELVEQNGERFYEAELFRVKGELSLKSSAREEPPETCFRQAIAIARRQSTKFWELRATTSLARLLTEEGKREEARTLLAEIHGWFTEGLDTPDLKDAKALLEELS